MYFECQKSVEDAEKGTLYMVLLIMKRVPTKGLKKGDVKTTDILDFYDEFIQSK